jgi:transketolase
MTTGASGLHAQTLSFGPRRAIFVPVTEELRAGRVPGQEPSADLIADLERYDLLYRTLCGVLYNFVPTSGHPGGSISSGRMVAALLFALLDYDFTNPDEPSNDLLVYAAGHKAMGLYAMWALRNEVVRVGARDLLPREQKYQLRLEDLLGFRRNPTTKTPLFREHHAKPLDGHPTPLTPGVRIATGASGVGVPAGIGLAFGMLDTFGPEGAPHVHLLEGEGGMTPGRVSEAMATAATAGLLNVFLHVDWNQASIDSNRVCRDGEKPGDYVQWNPMEMAYLHDWNVYRVDDGSDFRQILAGVELARSHPNDQPTAIVYRTVKGWRYGIEGRASHGAGHKFCSDEYYATLKEAEDAFGVQFPRFDGDKSPDAVERTFWNTLLVVRHVIEREPFAGRLAARIGERRENLRRQNRTMRADRPDLSVLYGPTIRPDQVPDELVLKPGTEATLRAALGDALGYVNRATKGGIIAAAADLLGSTSVSNIDKGFPEGFFQARSNPGSRLVACGGICEDCIGAFLAGLSSYGQHIGVGSSYAAFIAALQHIASRLHGIGQQARHELSGDPRRTFVMVCAHAGLKTGEDGPTHADPQALQLLMENFPPGVCITLTPWEPAELWPLTIAALKARPAILAPFVTRPNEKVPDRAALGLPPAAQSVTGIYALRTADPNAGPYHGTIVLQESGVVYAFVDEVLPRLHKDGLRMNIYLVTSPELFDALPAEERRRIFPPDRAREAMGITGFTLPTLYRWVASEKGRDLSLHAFSRGRYPGSGQAQMVLEEAGLDGESQYQAIRRYVEVFSKARR